MIQAGLLEILDRLFVSKGCFLIFFLLISHRKVVGVLGNLHFPLQIRAVHHGQHLSFCHGITLLHIHSSDFRMNIGHHIHAVCA